MHTELACKNETASLRCWKEWNTSCSREHSAFALKHAVQELDFIKS